MRNAVDRLGSYIVYLVMTFLLLSPLPAEAVQAHGGAEGLVSHQIGHLLFFYGMVYLLSRVYIMGRQEPGWLEFKLFLWFIIAWNILTFAGHWLHEIVGHDKFVKNADGRVTSFIVHDLGDAVFYLTRLDHVLLIPAFIFLLFALRKWSSQE